MRTLSYESLFSAACGLYWYCADHHDGQGSVEYRILCNLGYQPGLCENGPTCEESQAVYDRLRDGSVSTERLAEWIERNYPE